MPGRKDMAIGDQTRSMLTAREVGQLLHLHTNTVRRWSDRGLIRVYRVSHRGDRRYKREDIVRFLDQMNKNRGS